ncbi:MAG: RibD family protein, partial [Alphaproteobacteria bacterium]|nr:RibD family protein [Alphaproteobacteria bacterium]
GADPERRRIFQAAGVELIDVGLDGAGRLDLTEAMVKLGEKGLTRLLVEGGGHLAASLVMADLIDRIHWFRSPLVIGGDGVPALAGLGVHRLADATRFRGVRVERVGHDVLESLARRE